MVILSSDHAIKRLIWFLLAGSRGGVNRGKIVNLLRDRPYNMNQIAEKMEIDYKAVQHHINFLQKNNVVHSEGEKYGILFFLTPYFESQLETFDDIWIKIKRP